MTSNSATRRLVALTAATGLAVMGPLATLAHAAPASSHAPAPSRAATHETTPASHTPTRHGATTRTTTWATGLVNVNVRTGRGTDHERIGLLLGGNLVRVTGASVDGWTPVRWGHRDAWICSRYLSHTTRIPTWAAPGDHDSHSTAVQRRLASLGYFPSSWVGAPYGPATTNAVRVFQRAHGLRATGVTDTTTWRRLRDDESSSSSRARRSGSTRAESSPSSSRDSSPAPRRASHEEHASTTSRSARRAAVTTTGGIGSCQASFYDDTQTASGQPFNSSALTAASKTYAFGTRVKVTNRANGRSVVVTVNDRGPYVSGRCLDLTSAAFSRISDLGAGVADVTYQVVS